MSTSITTLTPVISSNYTTLWNEMVVNQAHASDIQYALNVITKNQARYQALTANIAVPWHYIGIMHYLEGNCDFTTHLYNGDTLTKRTTEVPANRPIADPAAGVGKPYTWEESAMDEIIYYGWDKIEVWDLPTLLFQFEKNNGFGYRMYHNINSPYLWSFSNLYTSGKYGSDGNYDSSLVSNEVGAAVLFKSLLSYPNMTTYINE